MTEKTLDNSTISLNPLQRLLSAFVDFISIYALVAVWQGFLKVDFDSYFLLALFWSCIYLTIGNSNICFGQTLGKKVFGLRTIDSKTSSYCSLWVSFKRFLMGLGSVILFAELPKIYFRAVSFVAESYILTLPMLICSLIVTISAIHLFFDPQRRTFYDLTSSTLVINAENKNFTRTNNHKSSKGIVLGIVFGLLVWASGFLHQSEIKNIHKLQYLVENRCNLRIFSMQKLQDEIEVFVMKKDLEASIEGIRNCFSKQLKNNSKYQEKTNITLQIANEENRELQQIKLN